MLVYAAMCNVRIRTRRSMLTDTDRLSGVIKRLPIGGRLARS